MNNPVERHHIAACLLAFVAPQDRPYVAAMLAQQHTWPPGEMDALAGLAGVETRDIQDCIRSLAMQRVDLAMQRSRAVQSLAADPSTRTLLLAAVHDQPLPLDHTPWMVRLRVKDRVIHATLPPTRESLLVVLEVFVDQTYGVPPPVERVVDVGANVGLATLWMAANGVAQHFVCVEPVPDNVRLLAANLEANGITAQVVEAAAGPHAGETTLHLPLGSHALASPFRTGPTVVAKVTPWEQLLTAGAGLKVDAEGAEHALTHRPDLLGALAWVVGEVHDAQALVTPPQSRALWATLSTLFDVQEGRPELFEDTLTRALWGIRRRAP